MQLKVVPAKGDKITQSGWLIRRFPLGFSSKRFCFFQEGELIISKDESCGNIDLAIQIYPETKIQLIEKKNRCFLVEDLDGNSAVLEAPDNEVMMDWILSLRSCCFITPSVSLSKFNILAVIGRGYYGKVLLIEDKERPNKKYAMKTIHKRRLMKLKQVETIINEKNILKKVRKKNPFIVSMKFCFQTASKFYVGMQFIPGGDLFHRMKIAQQNKENISIHDIRIYIGEVAIALNFLHTNDIIYRDLKPENVLIDEKGHIKLTDFGLSKIFKSNQVSTTFPSTNDNDNNDNNSNSNNMNGKKSQTFVGTPEYNAPEVVLRQPYDYTIDWWCLGILVCDLLYKKTPFFDKNESKMFKNIIEQNEPNFEQLEERRLKCINKKAVQRSSSSIFPNKSQNNGNGLKKSCSGESDNCENSPWELDEIIDIDNKAIKETTRSFILMLLKKHAWERPTFEQIMQHDFFVEKEKLITFEEFMAKTTNPIYKPTSNSKISSNFEAEFYNEKPIDSYVPPENDPDVNISDFSCSWLTNVDLTDNKE